MSRGFDVDAYLRDSFGVFKGEPEGDYEVVVDFDAWAADEIRGRKWHQSQEVTADGEPLLLSPEEEARWKPEERSWADYLTPAPGQR